MTPTGDTSALSAALDYLARGWAPVPMAPRSKRPLVPWRAYQDRAPGEAELRGWFARWPAAGVALVTGAVSGLVVLDLDPGHGGAESLAAIEARHGPLPETIEALTGGGGRHFYFAHPGGEIRNRAGLAPGLDLRGDGGIIIAPPSIHPSGNPYRWRPGHAPGEVALAPMPVWLLRPRFGPGDRPGHSVAHWRELVHQGVAAGQRNATLASFTGHLLWHGVDPDVVLELLLAWNRTRCRPPLADEEVIRTVRSIEQTHRRNRAPGAE
ncbi:bifunctional DNA primase/polymerase [Acidimangrovimonas pyrenivorans]|uniref:Bifunctional DNA primase/polymerase n=1 Tax=Acidimangrovimonas pyrenivorans TaxID=2030798 RepID=A0ABV7ALC3_9RHOB